jgi:Sulfotransferase domain
MTARWAYRRATAPLRALPDFLLIGAQRGGTTSLFEYLYRHPQVATPTHKEIHFFDDNWSRGVNWYRRFFPIAGHEKLTGESSPYYLFHPAVPERVAKILPRVRLIALLRDPISRAHSQYHHSVRLGYEQLSFEDALRLEAERLAGQEQALLADPSHESFSHREHSYATRGLYATQLERWLSFFGWEQLLVLRTKDLLERPKTTVNAVLEFLGLQLMDLGPQPLLNSGEYGAMSPEARAMLSDYFRDPNRQLSKLLDEDFEWDRLSGKPEGRQPGPSVSTCRSEADHRRSRGSDR